MPDLDELHTELRAAQKALSAGYDAWAEATPAGDMTAEYEAAHIIPLQEAIDKARLRLLRKPSRLPMDVVRKVVAIYGDELHCEDAELETLVKDARRFL